jgi:hypothetical protein
VCVLAVFVSMFHSLCSAAQLPEGVAVFVSAPKSDIGLSDAVSVSITYQNQSLHTLEMLEYGTALEAVVADDFLIVLHDGRQLSYQGIRAARVSPTGEDFTILQPGQSVTKSVDLESNYGAREVGAYQVFYRHGDGDRLLGSEAQFRITESRPKPLTPKQASTARYCTVAQASAADGALGVAESYARRAKDDLQNTPVNLRAGARRYKYWFGQYAQTRWDKVQAGMARIYSVASGRRITFDCGCEAGSNRTIAYVYPTRTSEVFLCDGFFSMPRSGGDSQASVLVHEISHFVDAANTDDGPSGVNGARYGQGAAVGLAITNPDRAVGTASNYQYFAANPTGLPMPTASGGGGDGSGGGGSTDEPSVDPVSPPVGEAPRLFLIPIVEFLLHGEQ